MSGRVLLVIAGAASLIVMAALLLMDRGLAVDGPPPIVRTEAAPAAGPDAEDAAGTAHREHQDAKPPEETAPLTAEQTTQEAKELEAALEDLRTALERSVLERLDPGAILDAALLLMDSEVDQRAVPELAVDGRLRFLLMETPDGVQAEVLVAKSNFYANVLALGIELDVPAGGPYMVDARVRERPRVTLTAWTDASGKLLHFGILTGLPPDSAANRALGLPVLEGKLTKGVLYHLSLEDPSDWGLKAYGYQNQQPFTEPITPLLDGGPWPRMDDIERFNRNLLDMYARIKER